MDKMSIELRAFNIGDFDEFDGKLNFKVRVSVHIFGHFGWMLCDCVYMPFGGVFNR